MFKAYLKKLSLVGQTLKRPKVNMKCDSNAVFNVFCKDSMLNWQISLAMLDIYLGAYPIEEVYFGYHFDQGQLNIEELGKEILPKS